MTRPAPSGEAETDPGSLLTFQPVYARNLDLKAFELILETPAGQRSLDDLQAVGQVIVESYTSIHQQGQLQTIPCFLKVTEEILLDGDLPELPQEHFILELSSDVQISPELCDCLRMLAQKGYLLALSLTTDDIGSEQIKPLLNIVHILKLDAGSLSSEEVKAAAHDLRRYNLDILADNLQSPEQFRQCLDAGFHYFRGDFLGKPKNASGKIPGTNKLLLIQLLAELEKPEFTMDSLERLIIQDANLTYKFIRVVNSASYGIDREIETLSHALAILGTKQIRAWVSMFLLEGHDDKPEDLIRLMLVRGRMCEILAELMERNNAISYFVVGLLSQLDVLSDIAMPDLMAHVPLKKEIKDALLSGRGDMGAILQEVEHYEQGRFAQLTQLPERSFYETAYRHSTAWARQVQSTVDK